MGDAHISARSRLSPNTPAHPLNMSRPSTARLRTLPVAALAATIVGPSSRSPSCPPAGLAIAHRSGSDSTRPLTRRRAASGSAPPAYVETTPTTLRIVSTTSALMRDSVCSAAGEMSAFCGVVGDDSVCRKSRSRWIWWSMWAVAYCSSGRSLHGGADVSGGLKANRARGSGGRT